MLLPVGIARPWTPLISHLASSICFFLLSTIVPTIHVLRHYTHLGICQCSGYGQTNTQKTPNQPQEGEEEQGHKRDQRVGSWKW